MQDWQRAPLWLWINLLGLDAPFVAVIWQDFVERVHPTGLRPAGRFALGLTVWAVYLADRLIDTRHPAAGREPVLYHFYRQKRRLARWLFAFAIAADALVICLWVRPVVLSNGLILAAGVTVYLAWFAGLRLSIPWKAPTAAILFTWGVFLVAWSTSTNLDSAFGLLAATFAALCFANLALVRRLGTAGVPLRTRAGIVALIAVIVPLVFLLGPSRWYGAIALSAGGLSLLAFWGDRFPVTARRMLADAVLLSPLLFR